MLICVMCVGFGFLLLNSKLKLMFQFWKRKEKVGENFMRKSLYMCC
jgi:hypothetical protein